MNQEELRKEAADKAVPKHDNTNSYAYTNEQVELACKGFFIEGAEWEAGREKWIEFDSMTKEDKIKFNSHPQKLIICQFDNGDVLRYDEEFPFSELTHIYFVPTP